MTEELALAEKYAFLNNGCSDLPVDMLSELNTIAAVSNAHKEQQEKVAGNYKAWLGGAEAAAVQLQEFSGATTHAESPKHVLPSMGRGLPVEHNVTNARWSKALDAKMLAEEALIMSRCPNLNNGCAVVDDGDLVYADESVLVKTADAALQHRLIAEEHAAMEKVAFLNNGCSDLALDMETELHSLAAAVSSANLIKTAGNYGDWVDSAAVADVVAKARAAHAARQLAKFGSPESAEVATAVEAAASWTTVSTPAENGYAVLMPVSRAWSRVPPSGPDWSYAIFDWDNLFASLLAGSQGESHSGDRGSRGDGRSGAAPVDMGKAIAYSNVIQSFKSKTAEGYLANCAGGGYVGEKRKGEMEEEDHCFLEMHHTVK